MDNQMMTGQGAAGGGVSLKQRWEVTACFEVWPGALGAVGCFRVQGLADHKLLPSVQYSLPLAKRHTHWRKKSEGRIDGKEEIQKLKHQRIRSPGNEMQEFSFTVLLTAGHGAPVPSHPMTGVQQSPDIPEKNIQTAP